MDDIDVELVTGPLEGFAPALDVGDAEDVLLVLGC